ncbi:hypothetical protein [Brucella haematophila]|uniref:hypothetical protein n=1 Tax=Brucella haematophila TaxID=419474 RepID=UPI001F197A60|nr:hypothetical protein [Brucella haematophila]
MRNQFPHRLDFLRVFQHFIVFIFSLGARKQLDKPLDGRRVQFDNRHRFACRCGFIFQRLPLIFQLRQSRLNSIKVEHSGLEKRNQPLLLSCHLGELRLDL